MSYANVEDGDDAALDDYMPTFYIGHHEYRRQLPVTEFALRLATDVGVRSYFENITISAKLRSMIW